VTGAALPFGTVTLLFSDIVGSTSLWEQNAAVMGAALSRHDTLLRNAIEGAGGHVFKTVGDGFYTVFAEAHDAVAAAVAAQRAIQAEPWPQIPIQVRMAMHSGVCELRDEDYYGPPANRTARLVAVGHGGQVLLSGTTRELVADALPRDVSLRDLGEHRLKDLGQPAHIFQLCISGLPDGFPPLRSLDNPALLHNLPQQPTTFVGRQAELTEICALIGQSQARLVTLTGAGGVGKTRLALQVAAELLDGSGEGVWMVELAPLADAELVPQEVASVLGVREQPGRPAQDTLVDAIADRHLLIVLDNCEQVVSAAAKLADALLRGCPGVHILATSQQPLDVDGEHVYRVPSLAVPASDDLDPGQLADYESVQLFIERAAAQRRGFILDEGNAAAVATLCTRLDGIPLAIELAAARLRSLSVADINARLDQRFRLLTHGSRSALPRHQTLRALIDWSYDLLNRHEQLVLDRLAIFTGGWMLEAAEAVAGVGEIEDYEVLDHLSALVDRSLVQADESDGSVRYRLLETVREYAEDRLAERGEDEVRTAKANHRDHYLALAETASPQLFGPDQMRWLDRLEAEHDNFRAALWFSIEEPDTPDPGLRLAAALRWFWETRGHRTEAVEALDALLARPEAGTPTVVRAAALNAASALLERLGNLSASATRAEEALAVARQLGDRIQEVEALKQLAWISMYRGDTAAALSQADVVLELARGLTEPHLLARCLNVHAVARGELGDLDGARQDYEEALAISRAAGDHRRAAVTLTNLGYGELVSGDEAAARAHLDEAVGMADHLGDPTLISYLLGLLGLLDVSSSNYTAARRRSLESLKKAIRVGLRQQQANAILGLALAESGDGDDILAGALHGVADGLMHQTERSFEPVEAAWRERDQSRLRETLGEARFIEAYERGRNLPAAEALKLVSEKMANTTEESMTPSV
jgi:predicted ATPase/class 3 adenylate cyclase